MASHSLPRGQTESEAIQIQLFSLRELAAFFNCELTPLDRVTRLCGRRFTSCIDLLADPLHAGKIERCRWSGAGAVLHTNAKLARIRHEVQESRGISAQGRGISTRRCQPPFLHLLLGVEAVCDADVIADQRLPRSGCAK